MTKPPTLTRAIARKPGRNFVRGLTTADLGEPRFETMLLQHASYVAALENLGLEVTVLEPLAGHPDGCFVEDVAVVTPEVAVIARPGAPSRQGETEPIEPLLAQYRETRRVQAPGTLDGGDVLVAGREVFVGISGRTNPQGAEQLGRFLEPFGYRWTSVPVKAGLHLKSSVSLLEDDTLLITREFDALPAFADHPRIVVDPSEEYAANTLWINDTVLTPAGFPRTLEALTRRGFQVVELEAGEARKMDGGLTCLSLRF